MPPIRIATTAEGLAVRVDARIDHVRARAAARGRGRLRNLAAERAGDHLDPAGERVHAVPHRCGIARLEDAALRDAYVEQVVEALVEEDVGIEDHDQVDPDHHLHHPFVEVEVDRPGRLVGGAGEVEDRPLALTPDRQLDPEGPVAAAVVIDEVLEGLRRGRDLLDDQLLHRAAGPCQQLVARREVRLPVEALAELQDPLLAERSRRAERHHVRDRRLRRPRVPCQHLEQ
jgi:hypothetical protein